MRGPSASFEAVHLEHEKVLFEAGEKVAAIYFPQAQLSRL